jgi:hypothetical protein
MSAPQKRSGPVAYRLLLRWKRLPPAEPVGAYGTCPVRRLRNKRSAFGRTLELVLALAMLVVASSSWAGRCDGPLTFKAVADAYVDSSLPTTNFGGAPALLADASPVCIGYLRFVVTGIGTQRPTRAIVRLQVDSVAGSPSGSGGSIHRISDDSWQEASVTYSTRPLVDGPALATQGRVILNQVVDFDVTGVVTGDGVYDFAIDTKSSNGVHYRSRAALSGRPKLILSFGPPPVSHLKTVFIMMLENHDWSSFLGNANAPYINQTLLPAFAHAENYRNAGLYPSLPNYITLEAGDDFGLLGQSPLPTSFRIDTTAHLTTCLNRKGISWKSYHEMLPGDGTVCPLTESGFYSADHNAFLYFNDVTGNPPSSDNAYCIEHIRPYSELALDLQANTVARYNFIVPDDLEQGEKHVSLGSSLVAQADTWLSSEVPKILASPAYQDGGVLFILWDEPRSHGSDHPIGCIVVSPLAKPGYSNAVPYSHASTLRTVQEIFGSPLLLRQAATANDLGDLFQVWP